MDLYAGSASSLQSGGAACAGEETAALVAGSAQVRAPPRGPGAGDFSSRPQGSGRLPAPRLRAKSLCHMCSCEDASCPKAGVSPEQGRSPTRPQYDSHM